MTISERIKFLRENYPSGKLSRREFGERMGVSAGVIQNAEEAEQRLKDGRIQEALINNICLTYNVNKIWLTTGEGEMFTKLSPEATVEEIMPNADTFTKTWMAVLLRLSDEDWAAFKDQLDNIDRIRKQGS